MLYFVHLHKKSPVLRQCGTQGKPSMLGNVGGLPGCDAGLFLYY